MSQRELLCADEDADLLQSKPKKKKAVDENYSRGRGSSVG